MTEDQEQQPEPGQDQDRPKGSDQPQQPHGHSSRRRRRRPHRRGGEGQQGESRTEQAAGEETEGTPPQGESRTEQAAGEETEGTPPQEEQRPQERPQQHPRQQQPQHQRHQPQQHRPQQQQGQKRQSGRTQTYFFSDAHLGIGTRDQDLAKERRIVEFLDFVKRDAEHLYIVGDLFDYWFEYRTVVPKGYYRMLAKFAELKEHGIRMSYIVGNHDFWLKDYFRTEFGMEILTEPAERTIRGHKFLLHHGDGLVKKDRGYRFLKRVLRSRVSIFLFSLLHPDFAARIARWSSHTSREYTSNRSYESNDMVAYASKKIRDNNIEFVVMGHNHVPQYRRIGRGAYVNLGDWISANSYAVFDGRRLELRTWRARR